MDGMRLRRTYYVSNTEYEDYGFCHMKNHFINVRIRPVKYMFTYADGSQVEREGTEIETDPSDRDKYLIKKSKQDLKKHPENLYIFCYGNSWLVQIGRYKGQYSL